MRKSTIRFVPLIIVPLLLAAACGSHLTEAEVIARSGTAVSTGTERTSVVGPDVQTDSTIGQAPSIATGGDGGGSSATATVNDGTEGGVTEQPCATGETGPILIGNVGNYSGPGGASQANFPNAVRLWANVINGRGGLCGREVQVIVQDDGGDPARYVSLIRELVESRRVVAFVGNGAVLTAQAGIDYHTRSGVPVIGNDGAHLGYFTSPVIAPVSGDDVALLTGMLQTGIDLAGTNQFGYVYCQEAESCHASDKRLRESVIPATGADLRYRKQVSVAQIDFTAECQAARDEGTQLFIVGADAATGDRFAQSCARQRWFPQYLAVGLTMGPDSLRQPGFETMIGALGTFPHTGASGGAIDEYNDARATLGVNLTPDPALSMGWAGAKLFELVATRAAEATGSITPESLVAALHTVQDETLGGLVTPLTFRPDGAHPAPCYFVVQGDGSGTGLTLPYGAAPRCL